VFAEPSAFVGRQVVVCGYLSGVSNILESQASDKGLSIIIGEKFAQGIRQLTRKSSACLEGEILHVGCATAICADWAFEYGIKVQHIRE